MTERDVADLLSLTGHELRAPAGVLGGYLALLEKHGAELSPTHQRALAGARRAQQRVVELLDELRRLAIVWHDPTPSPLPRTPVTAVATLLTSGATAVVTEVAPNIATTPGDLPLRLDDLRLVIDALAQTVVREHGGILRCQIVPEPRWCHIELTAAAPPSSPLPRVPFTRYRGGLGLTLVTAFALVDAAGGRIASIAEVDATDAVGLCATLPWAPTA